MPERKQKIKLIHVIPVAGLSALACIILHFQSDAVIIHFGIRFYRSLRNIVFTAGGAAGFIAVILYTVDLLQQRKWQNARDEAIARDEADRREVLEEKERRREILSVSRKMDSGKIRELLTEYAAGKWNMLSDSLLQLKIQLDIMDEHQDRLSHLLDINGADALESTEDILDRVEQYLCKNVRKALNYLDVADPAGDTRPVRDRLDACHEEGKRQLTQVQEFLFALADFLNRQGEDDNSMELLDIYKSTILSSIEDDQRKESET